MKPFHKMTLKELQEFYAVAKVGLENRAGQKFPAGTVFEIERKFGWLLLHELGQPRNRTVKIYGWYKLQFVRKDGFEEWKKTQAL